MSRPVDVLLAHMLEAFDVAAIVAAAGRDEFLTNQVLQYAADTAISRLGQGAKDLPDDVLAAIPGVPWRELKGMSDRLQHRSVDTHYELVWRTLIHDLPVAANAVPRLPGHHGSAVRWRGDVCTSASGR